MANIPVLEDVMTYIMDHPEHHNQAVWVQDVDPSLLSLYGGNPERPTECGTAACFAGWTALRHATTYGYEKRVGPSSWKKNDEIFSAGEVAEDILGLTSDEGTVLFRATNSRSDLQRMVKMLANGEDITPYVVIRAGQRVD